MKIYMSVDLEGISGIVNWDFASKQGFDYVRARTLMTEEVNAAIRGAVRAGASEILVNDSHNSMCNILVEELAGPARLLSGTPKRNSMMEGLDSAFDGVLLIGYHSRMNSRGVLNHTYSSKTVYRLTLNGRETGELGLNTCMAGHYGVPVLMVTGDDQVAQEAADWIPGVHTVTVKEARGRYAAICMNAAAARDAIEEGAFRAISGTRTVQPVRMEQPLELEVTFIQSGMADAAEIMPGVRRTGDNTLCYTAADIVTAYQAFRTLTTLANSVA